MPTIAPVASAVRIAATGFFLGECCGYVVDHIKGLTYEASTYEASTKGQKQIRLWPSESPLGSPALRPIAF
jgi:hypothetical protein